MGITKKMCHIDPLSSLWELISVPSFHLKQSQLPCNLNLFMKSNIRRPLLFLEKWEHIRDRAAKVYTLLSVWKHQLSRTWTAGTANEGLSSPIIWLPLATAVLFIVESISFSCTALLAIWEGFIAFYKHGGITSFARVYGFIENNETTSKFPVLEV